MELTTKSLKLIPLNNQLLSLWHTQGRAVLEAALKLNPNQWHMSASIHKETNDALENFWLVQTAKFPHFFAWYTNWEIILISENRSIGGIGFGGYPDDGQTEIGYLISDNEQRKGYATEALAAILDWGFGEPKLQKIIAHTPIDHVASQQVLVKNFFVNKETVFNEDLQSEVFRWEKLRK